MVMHRTYVWTCLLLVASVLPSRGQGVVSSASPEATEAGVEILNAGGNGVDAAVAVAFALGVTEPAGSGIGGQTFFLVHPPGKKPFVIHGTSYAPAILPSKISPEDIVGRRATTVPSTVRVLEHAWKNHGSGKISWAQLLAPAIRFAEEGYEVGHFRLRSIARSASKLIADPITAELYMGSKDELPAMGVKIANPPLAKCLRRLAEAGADDFYKGEIAKDIAEDMKNNGGWITLDDLQKFPEPNTVEPLHDTYRGYDVYTLSPPTGGWVVLLSLNVLERAPANALKKQGSDSRIIWLAETLRIAHANRVTDPITDMKNYAKQTAKKIDNATIDALVKTMQPPRKSSGGETTHFSLVDNDGMAIAVTASINAYFGAGVAHPKWGFLYNDYMHEFEVNQPGNPYNLRSSAMPYSSMSGTILAKDGKPVMAVGSPGSKRIISAVVQVISHWVDVQQGIKQAVDAPRLHVEPDSQLYLELRQQRIPVGLLLSLELRGYSVLRPLSSLFKEDLNPFFGGVHAVGLDGDQWEGQADPRRDGTVGRSTMK